jgi:hypothetical protein
MTHVRLYMDEDAMSRILVRGLRARGADIVTAFEAEMISQEDRTHLEHATLQGRTIYTYNTKHFRQIHDEYLALGKRHAGIIVVPHQRYPIGEQIRRLMMLIQDKSAEEMENVLHFL